MWRILVSVLTGILLTDVSLAQGSAQAQSRESLWQSNSVFAVQSRAQVKFETSTTASPLTNRSGNRNLAQATVANQLEDGTIIPVSLVKPVGARKNQSGDEVIARTEWDVTSEDGVIVLPVGSMVVGHITEVSVCSREHKVSAVRIVFDHALLTDGTSLSMALGIEAIGRVQENDASEVEVELGSSGERRALATRAMATPASMGGIMLRDALALMKAAANAAQTRAVTEPLTSSSQGVLGLPNLILSAEVSGSTRVSVVSSRNTNVRLNTGTEMILRLSAREAVLGR
jgi:hypothetical protein